MATISDLVAKLKLRAHVSPEERLSPSTASLDALLENVIKDAVEQHNPSYTVTSLPAGEEMLVLLLAQIELCYIRAEKVVNDAPIQAGGNAFSLAVDAPFNKNMKLAIQLKARYDQLISQMGMASGAGNVVVQSTVYKRSDRLDRIFPYFNVPAAPPALLRGTLQEDAADKILLEWEITPVEYFYRYWLFWSLTPGIYQDWNSVGVMTVPRIKSSASLIYDTYDQMKTAVMADGFPADSSNYFIIVTQTQQNKYTYSDEIVVETS